MNILLLLTPSAPVYEISFKSPHSVHIFAPPCNSITQQAIELESCSNP